MAHTPTSVRVTVQLNLPCELLPLAALAALRRPGPAVALVTRAVRDRAPELPAHVLTELHDVIDSWLKREGMVAATFDREPWQVALAAVRAARATPRPPVAPLPAPSDLIHRT